MVHAIPILAQTLENPHATIQTCQTMLTVVTRLYAPLDTPVDFCPEMTTKHVWTILPVYPDIVLTGYALRVPAQTWVFHHATTEDPLRHPVLVVSLLYARPKITLA